MFLLIYFEILSIAYVFVYSMFLLFAAYLKEESENSLLFTPDVTSLNQNPCNHTR